MESSIGLIYNQLEGFIDYAKAVIHLSNALKYRVPEETYINILMWRGNSVELIKKYDEALKDYLRGLLACSYQDLSGGWPEIRLPQVPFGRRSDDPKEIRKEMRK